MAAKEVRNMRNTGLRKVQITRLEKRAVLQHQLRGRVQSNAYRVIKGLMCIFIAKVLRVARTRILVAPLPGGEQLTVYENTAQTKGKNAMVLPVPQGPVRLVDTSGFPTLFAECEKLFEEERGAGGFGNFGFGFGAADKEAPLPVQRIGGYDVSVVPTLSEFSRLAAGVFTIPDNIKQILNTNYGSGFSFVVCVFTGTVQAHPIAYVSQRMAHTGQLFIPTRHAHGDDQTADGSNIAVHTGINCDYCEAKPIVGTRWKCATCGDFDLCDACYQAKRKQHLQGHSFIHLPEPIKQPIVFFRQPTTIPGGNFAFSQPMIDATVRRDVGDGDWDHTIFLVNAQVLAPQFYYDSIETKNIQYVSSGLSDRLARMLGSTVPLDMRYMSRMTVVGEGYGNRDYYCAEYKL